VSIPTPQSKHRAARLSPEVIARLHGLQLRARCVVDEVSAGKHRSAYRGGAAEFTEYREYVPGDDPRRVDWKTYAKSDRLYLKQFEAETHFNCQLLVDPSASMSYRSTSAPLSKWEYAQVLALALVHLVIRQRDRVGMALLDDRPGPLLPPGNGPQQMERIEHELEQTRADRTFDLGQALTSIANRLTRRGVIVIVSDFLGSIDSTLRGIRELASRKHEVLALQILDAAEMEFSFDGSSRFLPLEAGTQVVIPPRAIRHAYLEAMRQFLEQFDAGCQAADVFYARTTTSEPFDQPLRRLLAAHAFHRGWLEG
jgi:uncharacterized protein (DUF58 family)